MKKRRKPFPFPAALTAAALLLTMASCKDYDDFAFSGTVVDVEYCTSSTDCGYAIQLDTPDSLGSSYHTIRDTVYDNVVVAYGNDKVIHVGNRVSGRMYLDDGRSKAYCYYHYRDSRDSVHEAVFTELNKD